MDRVDDGARSYNLCPFTVHVSYAPVHEGARFKRCPENPLRIKHSTEKPHTQLAVRPVFYQSTMPRRLCVLLVLMSAGIATTAFVPPIPFLRGSKTKQIATRKEEADEKPQAQKRVRWGGALMLAATGNTLGAAMFVLPRPFVWMWRKLPGRLPSWWRTTGLTKDALGQIAFMASNVAYLGAGARMLLTPETPRSFGTLMLFVTVASCAYHAAQCLHGVDSEPTARACTVDSVLAVSTGLFFTSQVHVDLTNLVLAALSYAFFSDAFSLGYTTSHSMWHFSTAAMATVSRPRWQRVTASDEPLGRMRWLSRAWAMKRARLRQLKFQGA